MCDGKGDYPWCVMGKGITPGVMGKGITPGTPGVIVE